MNDEKYFETLEDLTLALMYMTRFKYRLAGDNLAWQGYSFDVLNDLWEKDLIRDGNHPSRTKSVYITPEGIERAKAALKKFGIDD